MNEPDYILNELMELSPAVANIARVNVFKVPNGYFETLAPTIMLQIHSDTIGETESIEGLSAPEGYFDNLATNILQRIKNESQDTVFEETSNISELVTGIGNKNVFTVVPGYFESIEFNVVARLNSEISLAADVTNETNYISELVAGIGNKNVFTVPQGYFENVAEQVSQKLNPSAKVISIKNRFTTFRLAAAAVITGLIGLSIFFALNKKTDTLLPTPETAAAMQKANEIIKTNSFDKELSSVSDADIVQFLESKGQNVEASLVASLDDDANLPDPFDYIINENTLDEVLKTIDLNN